jgi:hypothetical protein
VSDGSWQTFSMVEKKTRLHLFLHEKGMWSMVEIQVQKYRPDCGGWGDIENQAQANPWVCGRVA